MTPYWLRHSIATSLTAFSAKAQYLVTHDKHLLALRHYQGILIVSPPAFLSILRTL
jgi:predicted nucleic acid-binding protein